MRRRSASVPGFNGAGPIELRQWQLDALASWLPNRRGVVKVVTGAGKTTFALACIDELWKREPDLHVLIIVPTIPLLDQWTDAMSAYLGLPAGEIAAHGGGSSGDRSARLHVAVINTARTLTAKLVSDPHPWMLVVDECHRVASASNRVAMVGDFYATLGLSATPERQYDDWFEEHVEPTLGPVIFEYGYEDALRDGVISPFALHNYQVPLSPPEAEEISRLNRRIARLMDEGADFHDPVLSRVLFRRAAISQSAAHRIPTVSVIADAHRGRRTLVFHESIRAANEIERVLRDDGHRVAVYHSKLGRATRLRNLRMYRTGQLDVLVACRALDEGLDVPDTEVGVIAASTLSVRQRIQRVGRVLRPSPGKAHSVICTLYALDNERTALLAEAESLAGIAEIRWFRAVAV